MQQVGIRELKNRLTHYLESVKEGDKVVVTDRGKPVAMLRQLNRAEADLFEKQFKTVTPTDSSL